jgi:hypothetical protein
MELHSMALLTGQFSWLLREALLLYLGPETIMPVGSFLAAALGLFLLFWRQALALFRNTFKRIWGRKPGQAPPPSNLEGRGQGSPGSD